MSEVAIVLLTLIVYQSVLLGLGLWARSRSASTEGYLIGGYGLGPAVASLSYAAGSSSAWSILGVSGIAFSQGLSAIWLLPGTLLGHVVVWIWIAPRLQGTAAQRGWLTLTDVLADGLPSGSATAIYRISAFVVLFSFTFYIAAQFQGAANTFTAVFQFDFMLALLLGAAVVLLYTLWGGFWAVSVTDALQAALMLIAALVLPAAALAAVGGFSALSDALGSGAYGSLSGGHSGWFGVGFFLGMLSIGFGPLGQPHLLNRLMAMRERSEIKLARRIALTWFVVVLGGMFLLGLCGHVLIQGTVQAEGVFFELAQALLPPVITGVLIAAVLSAIMSTADSQLLVAGGAVHNDLRLAGSVRWPVATVAVLAVLLALYLPESIFSRVLFAWNALGAAFGPALLARLAGWRGAGWAMPLAIVIGFASTVLFYSLPNGPGDLWERAIPFLLASVTLWLARSSGR